MKYIGFGASKDIQVMLPDFINSLAYIVDDNPKKWGTKIENTDVVSIEKLIEDPDDIFIFILSYNFYSEIAMRLDLFGFKERENYMPIYDWFGNDDVPTPFPTSDWHEYQKTWNYNGKKYDARKRLMVSLLDFNEISSVADMGCGMMGLKKFLPQNVNYYPVDYIKRDDDTIICDFNQREFPDFTNICQGGKVDVIFLSGVLRYIDDWRWFLSQSIASSNAIILTYFIGGHNINLLQKSYRTRGYRHSVPIIDIVKFFEQNGWHIKNNCVFRTVTQILYFVKNESVK